MDDADLSQDRAEREAPYLLAASRKPRGPTATGRKFIGIERDPGYFGVAVGRISDAALFGPA